MRFSLGALAAIFPLAVALPQITRSGKYLYDPSGARFYIKGVAYQPQGNLAVSTTANEVNGGFPEPSDFVDPLSSATNCTRDIPYLKQLGVNAVRVYSVNASLNHDSCMSALDAAGIYVLLDVSLPLNGSIDRASPSWTTSLLNEYTRTVNAFNKYPNILAYNIGNEVINTVNNSNAAPFVKAAARDTKAYLRSIGSKALVGYAAVDTDLDFRNALADYLTCGNDSVSVDLYGLNNYEWCGQATYSTSGWNTITQGFSNLTVAAYMSEFGCITAGPRLWTEIPALLSSPVSDVFSGGIAFSYFPTSDDYGMVTFSADGSTVTVNSDFTALGRQYLNATGPNSPAQSSQSNAALACPASSPILAAGTNLPPTPNQEVCDCINKNALPCTAIPATANNPIKVGALINEACGLLANSNSTITCTAIAGDGLTGVYGPLAMCAPDIKLNYVMSAYYDANPVATSCDFGGNATLSTSPLGAEAAQSAAASCLAGKPPTFTPTASEPPTTPSGSSSSPATTSSHKPSSGRLGSLLPTSSVATLLLGAVGFFAGAAVAIA
ncbi:1,3-beta-glucanosyltransferase gel4 [Vanrija pseudolonga]|uniref:1,3-beta-glucanosyltransferase n=1 Tax=Vanrija pseudolonga TaxID=143232 RepID=A0AAF0YCA2_9TREE|nr:1,3-beta-glucanosyltransferase gel4 [Vanrija pseudolonga]